MEQRIAMIAGASGAVGRHLINELLASTVYSKVISIVRKPLGTVSEKLTEIAVDFEELDQLTDLAEVSRIDDVYCCLGTTRKKAGSAKAFQRVDRDYVLMLARLGLRLNMDSFAVISSIGAGGSSAGLYLQTKTEMELGLKALDIPCLNIFRPSVLHGERDGFRLGEELGYQLLKPLKWLPVLRKYQPVSTVQVAKAMLGSVTEINAGKGVRYIESLEIQQF